MDVKLLRNINFRKPPGFWNNTNHQRKFFDDIGNTLNVKLDDWKFSNSHQLNKLIIENGGKGILDNYNGSAILALRTIYSEYNWPTITIKPRNYWNNLPNQRLFFDDLGKMILRYPKIG